MRRIHTLRNGLALGHFVQSRRQWPPIVPLEAQPQEELCLAAVIGMRRVEGTLISTAALAR